MDKVVEPMIAIDPSKPLDIEKEMHLWTDRAITAISKGVFQGTVVGYWPDNSQILLEKDSRHFCLSFPPPKNDREESALAANLGVHLLHNNVQGYAYIGGVYLAMGDAKERVQGILTVGVQGSTKVCWLTPFKRAKGSLEVFDTTLGHIEDVGPWGKLLECLGVERQGMTTLMQEIYEKLVECGYSYRDLLDSSVRRTAAETRKIDKYKELCEADFPFKGMTDLELYLLTRTYLAARSLLPESELPAKGLKDDSAK